MDMTIVDMTILRHNTQARSGHSVRFDLSKGLVISTCGSKETPPSFSDIFVGAEDILVIFTSAQTPKTGYVLPSFNFHTVGKSSLYCYSINREPIFRISACSHCSTRPLQQLQVSESLMIVSVTPIFAASRTPDLSLSPRCAPCRWMSMC